MNDRTFADQHGNTLSLARTLPKHGVLVSITKNDGTTAEVWLESTLLKQVASALDEMQSSIESLRAGVDARKRDNAA